MLLRALAAAVVLFAVAPAYASSASAPLVVSVTVVRSCAVRTGAEVSVRCSASAGQPRIADARSPEPARPVATPATASAQQASDTRFVTINF